MDFHGKYLEFKHGFRLAETIQVQTDVVGYSFNTTYISLDVYGLLTIRKGFVWKASGPTFQTLNTREASCYHDALYALAELGAFDGDNHSKVRLVADKLLYDTLRANNMCYFRAQGWYWSVRAMGGRFWLAEK